MPLEVSILVASGDQDVADFLDREMLALGCHAVMAARHSQAVSATDAHDFHLALVTEKLEDGSGLEAVAALRRKRPRLIVYLVASTWNDSIAEQARRSGATRCVVRPTHRAAVEELLEDALEASCATVDIATGSSRRKPAWVE